MIRISVRGLAKYMTAGPAAQRNVLRDYKFPGDPEPFAMRLYYTEARDCVEAFHRDNNNRPWLRGKSADLAQLASLNIGATAARLRNNARALAQYEAIFGERRFTVLPPVRLHLLVGRVRVSIIPDLSVREGSMRKLVRIDFASKETPNEQIKIMCQCMFEAARTTSSTVTTGSILYLDVARGREHRGARIGARVRSDIEAACETIEAVWDSIRPSASRRAS